MGTWLEISLSGEELAPVAERVIACAEKLDQRLSTWKPDSELSQINTGSEVAVELSPETAAWLTEAARWRDHSGGAFNPAVTGVEWKIADKQLVRKPGVALDAGGFGKGLALREMVGILDRAPGVKRFTVNFGGQWVFNQTCTLGIAAPGNRAQAQLAVAFPAGSVATSGTSERGDHLVDPRTRKPAEDFGSVTVWSRDAFAADCLSTALFVLGPEKGLAFVETLEDAEALFIRKGSPERLCSSGWPGIEHKRGKKK